MKEKSYKQIDTGKRIRNQREYLSISRKQIANAIGLAPKYYADIERGTCGISLNTAIEIAKYLNLSLDYMILGKEN